MWHAGDQRYQFETDQEEQYRIEQLVDQFPELDDIVAGHIAHRKADSVIPDQQARHCHRERTRDMQFAAQRITAHHDRECDQYFQRIFIHAGQCAIADPTEYQPNQHAAARL